VTAVYQNQETGNYACEIAYGTKSTKAHTRIGMDIVIVNSSDLDAMGLPMATRFDLDAGNRVTLEWSETNFMPWSGYSTPRIGSLTLDYQKEYAWVMARRGGV
jgi:hypothetical protein